MAQAMLTDGNSADTTLKRARKIRKLLKKRNPKGETALHTACIKNNVELLKELLSQPDVDVNVVDAIGWTPLHEACNHGNLKCVELLLQYVPQGEGIGATGNQVDHAKIESQSKSGHNPVLKKADLNARGPEDLTPLHDAVWNDHISVTRLLLQHGGQKLLKAQTILGNTAFNLVQSPEMAQVLERFSLSPSSLMTTDKKCEDCRYKKSQTLVQNVRKSLPLPVNAMLVADANIVNKNPSTSTNLRMADETDSDTNLKRERTIGRLLKKRNPKGETALHTACIKNNVELLKELLSHPDVDVNVRDNNRWTPLHEACNHGNLKCVELLIQYVPQGEDIGATGNQVDHDKIESQSKSGQNPVLRKADLNARGPEDLTPLHDAVWNDHISVSQLLLQHGGQKLLKAQTTFGNTAFNLVQSPEMAQVLERFSLTSSANNSQTKKRVAQPTL